METKISTSKIPKKIEILVVSTVETSLSLKKSHSEREKNHTFLISD